MELALVTLLLDRVEQNVIEVVIVKERIILDWICNSSLDHCNSLRSKRL